jgi:integrase
MIHFKPCIREHRIKELNSVYIRVTQNRKIAYIPTTQLCHKSNLKNNEIDDITILANCYTKIREYSDRLNNYDISNWTVQEIVKFIVADTEDISFTNFANKHIAQMINDNRVKPANNYLTALNSLLKHYDKKSLFVSEITSKEINLWIKSLSSTARAKQMYPTYIKAMFEALCDEYNDYERGIMRIRTHPFKTVNIPRANKSRERFIDIDVLQKIFTAETLTEREQIGVNVAKLIFCLAGINTVDLYNIEHLEFKNGKLCYNRTKEQSVREDKAYFEITVPNEVLPLLEKYKNTNKTKRGTGKLLCFSDRYANADNFGRSVRLGLKSLCERENIEIVTAYFFRHTWSNIAKEKFHASTADIAFSLNHASEHKVTEKYFKKDWSVVDNLNRQIIDLVFNKPPVQG